MLCSLLPRLLSSFDFQTRDVLFGFASSPCGCSAALTLKPEFFFLGLGLFRDQGWCGGSLQSVELRPGGLAACFRVEVPADIVNGQTLLLYIIYIYKYVIMIN